MVGSLNKVHPNDEIPGFVYMMALQATYTPRKRPEEGERGLGRGERKIDSWDADVKGSLRVNQQKTNFVWRNHNETYLTQCMLTKIYLNFKNNLHVVNPVSCLLDNRTHLTVASVPSPHDELYHLLAWFRFCLVFLVFQDRVSICGFGCPVNSLCRLGWHRTQRSTCLRFPSALCPGS